MAVVTLLLFCLLSIVLIALKLGGILAISWLFALSPVPVFVGSFLLILVLAAFTELRR